MARARSQGFLSRVWHYRIPRGAEFGHHFQHLRGIAEILWVKKARAMLGAMVLLWKVLGQRLRRKAIWQVEGKRKPPCPSLSGQAIEVRCHEGSATANSGLNLALIL